MDYEKAARRYLKAADRKDAEVRNKPRRHPRIYVGDLRALLDMFAGA